MLRITRPLLRTLLTVLRRFKAADAAGQAGLIFFASLTTTLRLDARETKISLRLLDTKISERCHCCLVSKTNCLPCQKRKVIYVSLSRRFLYLDWSFWTCLASNAWGNFRRCTAGTTAQSFNWKKMTEFGASCQILRGNLILRKHWQCSDNNGMGHFERRNYDLYKLHLCFSSRIAGTVMSATGKGTHGKEERPVTCRVALRASRAAHFSTIEASFGRMVCSDLSCPA